jgi:hypothetical protein
MNTNLSEQPNSETDRRHASYSMVLRKQFERYIGAEVVVFGEPKKEEGQEYSNAELIFGGKVASVDDSRLYLVGYTANGLVHIVDDVTHTDAREEVAVARMTDDLPGLVRRYVNSSFIKTETSIPLVDITSCLVRKHTIVDEEIVNRAREYAKEHGYLPKD